MNKHAILHQVGQNVYWLLVQESKCCTADYPVGDIWTIEDFIPILEKYNIRTLWVMPRTQLSHNVSWLFVQSYDHSRYSIFPEEPIEHTRERKPTFLRIRRIREGAYSAEHFVAFPEYEDWTGNGQLWNVRTPQDLLDTVYAIEDQYPGFAWSPQNMGRRLLGDNLRTKGVQIEDTIMTELLGDYIRRAVYRPTWCQDKPLTAEQLDAEYAVGSDKNWQFGGGCSTRLGNGQYTRVSGNAFVRNDPGLWLARVTDVSKSIFDSYRTFCPWTAKEQVFSTDLLIACRKCGIDFEVVEGIVWTEHGQYMENWRKDVWSRRATYYDEVRYPNKVARLNAQGTAKQAGNSLIGLLGAPKKVLGTGMICRQEWNVLIIHCAIANFMYSVQSRYQKFGVLPIVVARGDTQWFLSDTADIPTLFDHEREQRGWKRIGRPVPLDSTIIEMFAMRESDNELKASVIAAYLEQRAKE